MSLFKRVYELRVGDTALSSKLDVSFSIDKTIYEQPNTCEIKIWNLSEDVTAQVLARAYANEIG